MARYCNILQKKEEIIYPVYIVQYIYIYISEFSTEWHNETNFQSIIKANALRADGWNRADKMEATDIM